jgi:hypothetical protein
VKVYELMDQMANRREKRLAAILRKSSNGGGLNLGGNATTAFATSTAIESDWEVAKTAVYNDRHAAERRGDPVREGRRHGEQRDAARHHEVLRQLDRVHRARAERRGQRRHDPAARLPRHPHRRPVRRARADRPRGRGQVLSDVWGTSVRFLYVPDGNGAQQVGGQDDRLFRPATCYTFSHAVLSSDATATAGQGPVISTYRTVDPTKEYILAEECFAEKITAPDLGYELTSV